MSAARAIAAGMVTALLPLAALAAAEDVVRVEPPALVVLRPGGEATAKIVVRVKRGFHVQANPVLNPDLIPIVLSFEDSGPARAGRPIYPAPKRMRLRGADDDLLVLDGRFTIAVPIRLEGATPPGELRLVGKLRYQACDDERCLFPRTARTEVPIRIPFAPAS